MIELSRLRESERYPAHSDEVTANPPPGSPRQPNCCRRICAEGNKYPSIYQGKKTGKSETVNRKFF